MISALYLEEAVRDHPRAQALIDRFPKIPHIICGRYGEVFNRRGQDFRVQKTRPSLILAEKREHHVLATPPSYGIGGQANYYFSHILNCLYDCRYCFLQGLYQSANYVFFLNFEDYQKRIDELLDQHARDPVYLFSGYDGDSFALEGLTHFVRENLAFFQDRPRAMLELRTKSLKAGDLLDHEPSPNVVVAFSLTPQQLSEAYENGVPPLAKRLHLMQKLADQGWPIGLRLDPVIVHEDYQRRYRELIQEIFARIQPEAVHSVSLGVMRFPKAMHKQMARLYPDEALFAANLKQANGQVSCAEDEEPLQWLATELREHLPADRLFVC